MYKHSSHFLNILFYRNLIIMVVTIFPVWTLLFHHSVNPNSTMFSTKGFYHCHTAFGSITELYMHSFHMFSIAILRFYMSPLNFFEGLTETSPHIHVPRSALVPRWCLSMIYDTNHCLHVHVSVVHRYSFGRLMTWKRPKWPPPLTKDWVTIVIGSVASSLYALCYTLRRACVCLRRYIRRQLAPLLGVSYFFLFFPRHSQYQGCY